MADTTSIALARDIYDFLSMQCSESKRNSVISELLILHLTLSHGQCYYVYREREGAIERGERCTLPCVSKERAFCRKHLT